MGNHCFYAHLPKIHSIPAPCSAKQIEDVPSPARNASTSGYLKRREKLKPNKYRSVRKIRACIYKFIRLSLQVMLRNKN